MYKLLIVDDDEIICRGLATCIPWQNHEMEVIDTANDGEMALESVERNHPDVILADINMPFMDGMEFSYQVRQKYPEIKIILITAYREFEYARRAVELQVFDFVAKPFTNEEMLNAVIRARDVIIRERRIEDEVNKNMSLIKEKYLSEAVLFGEVEEGRETMCGFHSIESEFTVAVMSLLFISNEKEEDRILVEEEAALQIAAERLREGICQYKDVFMFRQSHQIIFILENRDRNAKNHITSTLKQWMNIIAKDDVFFLTCGVGERYPNVKNLPFSLAEARKAVEYQYYFGHLSVIFYEDIVEIFSVEPHQSFFTNCISQAAESVRSRNSEKLRGVTKQFFEVMKQGFFTKGSSPAMLSMELLGMCYHEAHDTKLYEDFLKQSAVLYPILLRTTNIVKMQELTEQNLNQLIIYMDDNNTSSMERMLQNAVHYMEEHYEDSELTLKEVAESVPISASYLCTLFKQHMQTTYINHLTKIRLEHAKRILMENKRKTYEVAFLAGYNSSQYFSSSFKKYTGMTPGEYRTRHRKGGV